jgi:hypothetical protein
MQLDISAMEAEVYTNSKDTGIYYVKITFPNIGMYINSITVRPSPYHPGEQWVQMPAKPVGPNRWIHVIEFKNGSQLQDLMRDAALRAVDAYNHDSLLPDVELEDMDDKALGQQMDKTLEENGRSP